MIALIEDDHVLEAAVRRRASDIRPLAGTDPELACKRLIELAIETAPTLLRSGPEVDLAKCTGVEDYWQHYLDRDLQAFFRTAEEYRRDLDARPDIAGDLHDSLKEDFLNRLDAVIPFRALAFDDLCRIAVILLKDVADRIVATGATLEWSDKVVEALVTQAFDARLGARPLKRPSTASY
jgi:hypothetical protein